MKPSSLAFDEGANVRANPLTPLPKPQVVLAIVFQRFRQGVPEVAELWPHAPAAAGVGSWLDGWLFAQSGPIYAGTNEIQRNIIAERMLGMPR